MSFLGKKCFFHVDLDAFFASVEQKEHPEYKGKPVIVGGLPGDRRSVVSTASYEARAFGVHSAMSISEAYRKCPEGIFLRGNMALYVKYSRKIMAVFDEFSPDVHQLSVDEAFLDMTGTERLFGDQKETALKLKKRVFEETGLTCSVGIASTNYIAKICSGYRKPDGLYTVLPGDEESFMLSLPLSKVWGIGEKTLQRLNAAGFKTTKDVHAHSLTLLEEVFGESTGAFLYNAVHGIEPVDFFSEAKSHSIGNENTYEYDLSDSFAIESALLELSEGLMFRLLENNLTGKTVQVKIRYEDFTTVTVQGTSTHAITNSDELYERALELFRKKYESGRGIRLLGVSINNTESQENILEKELFDFGEEKKRQVEKSILNLKKKNPGLEIHKARLLKTKEEGEPSRKKFKDSAKTKILITIFMLLSLFSNPGKAKAEDAKKIQEATGSGSMVMKDTVPPEKGFEGTSLFYREYKDNAIEFLAKGFWDSKIKQTITASGGFGNSFNVDFGTPAFVQEVDMTVWFLLNNRWYFEAAFADAFNKNTIAAGYKGNGFIREIRIANRKVIFPGTYSINDVNRGVGGSDNQAPGVSASFQDPDGRWKADAVFRYDMLSSKSKTYYGKNSVNDTNYAKENFQTGHMYVLPLESSVAQITGVYVESYNGSYTDTQGLKYKKLSDSDYLLVPSKKLIVLSKEAGAAKTNGKYPAVSVTLSSSEKTLLASSLGSYGTASSPGTGFLGKVQKLFGKGNSDTAPDIGSFSYGALENNQSGPDKTGTKTDGFFSEINGEPSVYLQHPAGFSPFTVCLRYDAGSAVIDDIAVIHKDSNTVTNNYSASVTNDDYAFVNESFTTTKKNYLDVRSAECTSTDYTDPLVRYPFASDYPGTYLGYSSTDDLTVRIRHYIPVNRFDIGTNAIDGTVQVYKNGIIDSSAKFNQETGEVTLSSGFSELDKIYIVWYEDSKNFETGSVTGALGFNYNFTESLSGDLSLATRWSVNQNVNYADSTRSSPGYLTLASRISYDTEDFKVSNTISGTVENDNTTGFYRLLSMSDKASSTSYLSENAGNLLPDNFSPRLNSRPEESTTPIDLSYSMKRNGSDVDGKKDSGITGYKIPVTFNFSGNGSSSNPEWAATSIKISGSNLSSASTFSFAIKNESGFTTPEVYLQLGVDSSKDFSYESRGTIPTWKISSSGTDVRKSFNPASSEWQTVTVVLTDQDRSFCTKNTGARLIVVNGTSSTGSGAVYFGPYEISETGMEVSSGKTFTITKGQVSCPHGGEISFTEKKNYAEEISWSNNDASVPSNGTKLTMYKYFPEADPSQYKYVKMVFKSALTDGSPLSCSDAECTPGLTFLLDTDSDSVSSEGTVSVKATISSEIMKTFSDSSWHTLSINLFENEIKIDSTKIPSGQCDLYINKTVIPTRIKLTYNTAMKNLWYREGSFYIDELYFSENSVHFLAEDKASLFYKKDGPIISSGDYALLKDFHVKTIGDGNVTLYTNPSQENKGNGSGQFETGFTLFNVIFNTNLGHAQDSKRGISEAGHSVKSEGKLGNVASFSETYNFNTEEKSVKKDDSFSLDFSRFKVPLSLSLETKTSSDLWSVTQSSKENVSLNLHGKKSGYVFNAETEVSQKILPSVSKKERIETDEYFESYGKATAFQFSSGASTASTRTEGGKITNKLYLPWIKLQPEMNFYAEGNYSASSSNLYSDTSTFEFKVPFTLGSNSISFSWKKSSGSVNSIETGGDYFSDIDFLASSFSKRDYFFSAPVFYDLFSDDLSSSVHSKTKDYENNSNLSENYSGIYALNFSRQIYASVLDFFVPSSASLNVSRDIRTTKTLSDTYQYKTTIGYTAFNVFGTNGSCPIFSWFQDDEYITSFIATYRVPRSDPSDLIQIYTFYFQNSLYFTRENVLRNGVQFEFQDENNFQTKYSILWNRPSSDSIFLAIARLFKRNLDTSGVKVTRTNGFNCVWKKSSSSGQAKPRHYQSYDFTHKVDMQLTRFASLYAAIEAGYSSTWDEVVTVTASWTLGGKLQF